MYIHPVHWVHLLLDTTWGRKEVLGRLCSWLESRDLSDVVPRFCARNIRGTLTLLISGFAACMDFLVKFGQRMIEILDDDGRQQSVRF